MIVQVGAKTVELVEKIGDGGTGEVFKGRDKATGEPIALKVLHKKFAENPEFRRRYSREARALGQLTHPSFVKILGEGELQDGRVYLAMELVTGPQAGVLQSRVKKEPYVVLQMFIDVAHALHEAHEVGIVHRDIKPENLVYEEKKGVPRLRILDFGFVRFDERHDATDLTQQGIVLGTVGFMSVEQLSGLPVDGRADVYALAVCIYETWCGKLPFNAKNPMELFKAQSQGNVVPLEKRLPGDPIAAALSPILTHALARDRENRTPTMAAFASELASILPKKHKGAGGAQKFTGALVAFTAGVGIAILLGVVYYFFVVARHR
ncbi:MAG: serine/threonine-protein kinase [Polyangiaceae bacterium]